MKRIHAFSLLIMLALSAVAQEPVPPVVAPKNLEADTLASIRTAFEADRHKAFATEQGCAARNPSQRWLTQFDGRGFLVQPNSADWSWGLQLEAYGFEGAMLEVAGTGTAIADGNRTAYDWDSNLREWYVNDARGLEHGFTLQERPERGSCDESVLSFDLAVRGTLQARVFADGKGAYFVNSEGASVLSYVGLHVFDANGVTQSATFVSNGKQLIIEVEESGAKYPLTIDPIAQQAYLKASNTGKYDSFGWAVAVSGNTAVVGAHREGSGIPGDQGDNSIDDAGAVYVFERSGGVWVQQAYLKASNPNPYVFFGASVAILDNLIVVGAPGDYSNATGVNGDQVNHLAVYSGAVHVFVRSSGVWREQAYLKASNTEQRDRFGSSVAISGNLIVVGAPGEDSDATGVNGNQDSNSLYTSGAAYVFERSGGIWSQQAYLKASNSDADDNFGYPVAIDGERIVVGSNEEDSGAAGVNGNQLDNSALDAGSAYAFSRNSGVWSQEAYLKPLNPDSLDMFGRTISISDNVIVIGAEGEDSNASGINGDHTDNSSVDSGAVYVFELVGGTWSQQAYIKASNSETDDRFGWSVSKSGNRILVGARWESGGATGINGNQELNDRPASGAAYLFEYDGGAWAQQTYLKASNPDTVDLFGYSVALDRDLALVGAPWERSSATGVNGDQSNNLLLLAGATYVFDLASPVATYCGSAVLNSTGSSANIFSTGSRVVMDNSFTLHATNIPAGQYGYFLYSMGQGFVSNVAGSQGNLCLGGGLPIGRHHPSIQNSGAAGSIDFTLDLASMPTAIGAGSIQSGETWNFQCWFRDQNPGSTSNLTNGLSVLFE